MTNFLSALLALFILLSSNELVAQQPVTIVWEKVANSGGGAKAPIELQNGELLANLSQADSKGVKVVCLKSTDAGVTWRWISTIIRHNDKRVDIGDGHFLQLSNGDVLYSYRHILYLGLPPTKHTYSIKIAVSKDNGMTWSDHSTVMSSAGRDFPRGIKGSVGLWSSFLLQTRKRVLQCYYDDEYTPYERGFQGHQWITMKTWNVRKVRWENPVTVSRAKDSRYLSRDGSCAVVEMAEDQLLVALESVKVNPPHRALVRYVMSHDGGRTWSWERKGRSVLYETADRRFNAAAPWIVRLSNGSLVCVFHTDEDRQVPDEPYTGILDESLKYVVAPDGGCRWSETSFVLDNSHPIRLPGIIELRHGSSKGKLLAMYIRKGKVVTKTGVVISGHSTNIRTEAASRRNNKPATSFVEIILGPQCGEAHGQNVSIVNAHPSRTIRVRLSKEWCKQCEPRSRESTFVLRPGEDHAQNLGCNKTKVAGKDMRSYRWRIVNAEFK